MRKIDEAVKRQHAENEHDDVKNQHDENEHDDEQELDVKPNSSISAAWQYMLQCSGL